MSIDVLTSRAAATAAIPLKSPLAIDAAPVRDDRLIGVEIEFAELPVPDAAALTATLFGGEVETRGRHHAFVRSPALGAFTIELDTALTDKIEVDSATLEAAKAWFGDVASLVVPVEIACPPMPTHRLAEVDKLVAALRRAGARGCFHSLFYAFGTHLNVEVESDEPNAVLNTLRAYILLEDWLRAQINVNSARSVAGFEKRFPLSYQRRVLADAYAPGRAALISDYLAFNPTRNRGLDLLPLMAELDGAQVRAALPTEKIAARPAYHYRLPNSEVDDPNWTVRRELRRWAIVERLAMDQRRLACAMAERLALLGEPLVDIAGRREQMAQSMALGAEMAGVAPGERLQ